MEKVLEIKPKKIDLTCIRVVMEVNESSGVDINYYEDEEENDNDYEDLIMGKVFYDDPDSDEYEEISIGTFKLRMIFGSIPKIYYTLSGSSIADLRYEQEIFDIKYYNDGSVTYDVREEYERLIPESVSNSFIILDRIEIDEQYRGNGIIRKVINTIERIYRQSIILKPFPLQHEGNVNNETFKSDQKKLIDSYKKCGFKRVRKRSEYFVKW